VSSEVSLFVVDTIDYVPAWDVIGHDFAVSLRCTIARQTRGRGGYLKLVNKVCDGRRICRCVLQRKERVVVSLPCFPIFVPTRSAERFCLRSSPTTHKSPLLIVGLPLVIPDPTVHEGRPCLRRVLRSSFPSARCFITIPFVFVTSTLLRSPVLVPKGRRSFYLSTYALSLTFSPAGVKFAE